MNIYQRTRLCVILNCLSVVPILLFAVVKAEWRFGPSEDLVILSIHINTWSLYITLLVLSVLLKVLEVILSDIGAPNLGFSIYDPTKTTVYGFTKCQLETLANLMWASQSLGNVFKIMILVSRLDVALISLVFSEIASCFVIKYLLSKKKEFIPQFDTESDYDEFHHSPHELFEIRIEK